MHLWNNLTELMELAKFQNYPPFFKIRIEEIV